MALPVGDDRSSEVGKQGPRLGGLGLGGGRDTAKLYLQVLGCSFSESLQGGGGLDTSGFKGLQGRCARRGGGLEPSERLAERGCILGGVAAGR